MQLITSLLYAVAVLTFLTGLSILFGATKQARGSAVWFCIATVGAAVWSSAIAAFLTLSEAHADLAPLLVVGIIAGITLTDVALIGYTGWDFGPAGKVATLVFAALGAALVGLQAYDSSRFYTHVTFGNEFNTIHTAGGWYLYLLIAFFFLISLVYSGFLGKIIAKTKNKGAKNGFRLFRAGLSVGGILALVFDLLLLSSHPHLSWIGPMAVSISVITFYYSIVRYRILALRGDWMNILSYIILTVAGVIVYLMIFYAVFTSMFRVSSPSSDMLVFNLIMVAIFLLLMPAVSEVSSMIRAFLPNRHLDMGYIVKKLNLLNKQNVELKELANFLATQLKLDYVGFLINGRLYSSRPVDLPSDALAQLAKTKPPKSGLWQDFTPPRELEETVDRLAVLYNSRDEAFGEILLGKPSGRHILEKRDLIQIEMVLRLAGVIIDGEAK